MGGLFAKLFSAFYSKKRDIVLVGLDNSGKSTLLAVLANDAPITETCPTIGMHVQVVKKNNVVMKCWDIGGQKQYRGEWGRYASGCDAIIFVVDVADIDRVGEARKELHRLLEARELATTPILICANKIDIHPHLSEGQLIKELNLDYVLDNPWMVVPTSALKRMNIDRVLDWLIKQPSSK